ncbi:hypothetical protein [Siccirubricoccus sp. G192]|uniref:hypothetical protein n=1 Tax=Siccirubricoccus sp. G192 TaxID=2849651 RepID=UPI001C2C6688|nr:hypothetical protein [Siccirubricoccus sp. G192]MBV1796512.1 hypothetical protein [Siccirubricoccus sp. G192]
MALDRLAWALGVLRWTVPVLAEAEEVIEGWRAEVRTGRGGDPKYSNLAITIALTLRSLKAYSAPPLHCLALTSTRQLERQRAAP